MAKVNATNFSIELSERELDYLKSLVGFVATKGDYPHAVAMADLYWQIDAVYPKSPAQSPWRLGEFAVEGRDIDWNEEEVID